jgi:hypothetical protein
MSNFSIGEAWAQCTAFISAHLKMIAIYVAAGVLIPQLLNLLLLGGAASQAMDMQAMMQGGGNPLAAFSALGAGFILISIVGNIIQSTTTFAALRHGMTNGSEAPQEALTFGVGAAVLSLLATIAIGIVAVIVLGLLFAAIAAIGSGALTFLALLAFAVAAIWFFARISVTGPAMADARNINPLYGLATSWRLTGPAQWKIFAYFLLLGVVAFVIVLLLGLVLGASFGPMMMGGGAPGGGGFLTLVIFSVLISIPLTILTVGIQAGIYRVLVPANAGQIFA